MEKGRKLIKKIGTLVMTAIICISSCFIFDGKEAYAAGNVYQGIDYSAVFDYDYYYNMYGDLQRNIGYNQYALLQHFVTYGMNEGRIAKQSFDVKYYQNKYSDLRRAFGNNLKSYYIHYMNYGKKEGRQAASETVYLKIDYAAVYDKDYYYKKNKSTLASVGYDSEKLITHFVKYGMAQGLRANEDFDVKYYQYRYSDLKRAFGNNYKMYYLHYIEHGIKEGRTPMSTAFYKGVDYSAVYSKDYYYHNYADLQRAFGYDTDKLIEHFITYGMKEGRQATLEFSPSYYKSTYTDLQRAFKNDWGSYYIHYMTYGVKEKRKGNIQSNYNGWNVVKGDKIYYQNGEFLKGWQTIKNRKYYFSETGVLKSQVGIDVSSYQGEIDWEQVKRDGIEFAIIRLGYGNDMESQDDAFAARNMDECERLGIPYGVYLYSYALSNENLESEINHALRLLEGRNPEIGVFFDYENDSYKDKYGMPSSEEVTKFAIDFNEAMIARGYKSGTYTYNYFWDKMLFSPLLNKYPKWLADYGTNYYPTDDTYMIWQYTSGGTVTGISGRVDMNVYIPEWR